MASPCVAAWGDALDGPRPIAHCCGMDPERRLAVALSIGVATTVTGGLTLGCAGFGEAAGGVCLALAIQTVGQVCCEAACGAATSSVCGDDGADTSDDDVADQTPADAGHDEIPPHPPLAPTPPCRIHQEPGGVWHLDCVDGTSAEALQHEAAGGAPDGEPPKPDTDTTVTGDVRVASLADVARLAGVRAVLGTVTVTGVGLLRVSLPSLKSVEGDLVVADTVHLGTMTLSSLRYLGGRLRVVGNRALQGDPVPALTDADDVDVAFNDALSTAVTDRLLAIRPRRQR
jgi:hypothetical protein